MVPQGISSTEEGNNAEIIKKADVDGILGYVRDLTDLVYEKSSTIIGKVYT